MRKIFLITFVIFMTILGRNFAQTATKGIVRDLEGNPLTGVSVKILGTSISKITNSKGEFNLPSLPLGFYLLSFSLYGYQTLEHKVELRSGLDSISSISLKLNLVNKQDLIFPELTISSDEINNDPKSDSGSGLIQSSEDPFEKQATLSFRSARFKIRGYDSDKNQMYMNGIPVNDPECGFSIWDTWGGLADVTHNIESRYGLLTSNFSFGGIGGVSNINTRASLQPLSTKMSYASTNRTYSNQLMVTHSTGMMENDVAIILGGTRRWAQEGYIDGSFYDAYAYFISIERKFDNNHSVSFTTFNAPNKRGMQGAATEEVNQLVGSNFYNPNWGFQNDKKRNSRILNQQKPTFMLNHFWNIDEKASLTTSLGYTFGTYSTTSLNWYNVQNPNPDYYSKLPSYWSNSEKTIVDQIIYAFKNDVNTRQLDWNSLYQNNYRSDDTANYIIEERITESKQVSFSSVLNWDLSANLKISSGIEFLNYRGRNYKTVNDLLGGKYWIDNTQFAERDFGNHDLAQNDLDNPDREVLKGDAFGYDYIASINNGNLWFVSNYITNKFDLRVGAKYEMNQFWRRGSMRNGRFPINSMGNSEKQVFHNFGLKGNATWNINNRNFIDVNAALITKAPYFRNSFVSPRLSNLIIPDISNEKIVATDINYHLHSSFIKTTFSAYFTQITNEAEMKSFFIDSLNTFANYALTGMNKEHKGIEFGAEINASSRITINIAASLGSYKYTSRPNVTITKDNSSSVLSYEEAVYIKNFHLPNTPQTAMMMGVEYTSPKLLYLSTDISYFTNIYLDFNPERRTDDPTNPNKDLTSNQQKLSGTYLIDANIGKSWKIDNNNFSLNFQIANVLNKTNFQTGGFEQMRYSGSTSDISRLTPRYYYAFGRTYFLNLVYRF